MIDMSVEPVETTPDRQEQKTYPYGLCLCLTQVELDKLGLEDDCEPGDLIHLMAMAKVTSVSKNATPTGDMCRIELQITHLSAEDEDTETEEPENPRPRRFSAANFYKD